MAHHGIIKIIFIDALESLQNHVDWANFMEMERAAFLKIQAQAQLELREVEIKKGSVGEGAE